MNVKELTHSQKEQPQAPQTHKKESTVTWSWMKSSAKHTLSNQQAQPK